MVPGFVTEITRSTALTLELSGAVDAPVTRAPEFSAGLLLGVTWLEQRHSVEVPRLPNPNAPWQLIVGPRPP
jgi:hypothetical protein